MRKIKNDYEPKINTIECRRFQCEDRNYKTIDNIALMSDEEESAQLPEYIRVTGAHGSFRTLENGELRIMRDKMPGRSYITSKVGKQVLDADPTKSLELEARLYIGECFICGGGHNQPNWDVAIIAEDQHDADEFIKDFHFNWTPVSFIHLPAYSTKTTYWEQGKDTVIVSPSVIQKYQEQQEGEVGIK